MKTASLWGSPPSRYYRLLRRIEAEYPGKNLHISILGASDGKFVLPAARRGHNVFAIDIDETALFGGKKIGPNGPVYMDGLDARLQEERLSHLTQVVQGDFVMCSEAPRGMSHFVFTSGSIQYSYNLKHGITAIVNAISAYARLGGYIYIDYMLPITEIQEGRPNFFRPGAIRPYLIQAGCEIIYDRVLQTETESGHVDNPEDHEHRWGHLLAQKVIES